jgi:negative regulator of sigma E activity
MESEVNRNIEEQLSAFLDGELSSDELQLLVRRLERNDEYRATLSRYAGIGGMLRNDGSSLLADQLRRNVMSALEVDQVAEPAAALPAAGVIRQSWFKPAIAAGFAVVAIAGLMTINIAPTNEGALEQTAALVTLAPEVTGEVAEVSVESIPAAIAEIPRRPMSDERMLSYLVSHGEYARSFQGTMMDSRVFVQQASFAERR